MANIQQVFIGCPFASAMRAPYDRLKKEIEGETPLSLVLADTVGVTSSDYLLEHITNLIRDSAGCIFDATGSNPNVSLEIGIAHTVPVDFVLTIKTRKPRTSTKSATRTKEPDFKSIITDLQGKPRLEYKTYESLKDQVMRRYLSELPYMKRWMQFKKDHHSMSSLVAPLFSDLRSSGRSRTARLDASVEGSGFTAAQVREALERHRLVLVKRGRHGGIFYPTK